MDMNLTEICTTSFYSTKLFNTLPEALDSFSDNTNEEDILLLPPEPNYVTDEEEYDDNDLTSIVIPNDVPGPVEIGFSALEDDIFSSSDDEPLSEVTAKKKKKNNTFSWEKANPDYRTFGTRLEARYNERSNPLISQLKNLTPTAIFEKIVDESVIQLIVDQTNLYAQQKNNHNFCLTASEARTFIGILLLTGYHHLPQERIYWSHGIVHHNIGHYPKKIEKQLRCAICHSRIRLC